MRSKRALSSLALAAVTFSSLFPAIAGAAPAYPAVEDPVYTGCTEQVVLVFDNGKMTFTSATGALLHQQTAATLSREINIVLPSDQEIYRVVATGSGGFYSIYGALKSDGSLATGHITSLKSSYSMKPMRKTLYYDRRAVTSLRFYRGQTRKYPQAGELTVAVTICPKSLANILPFKPTLPTDSPTVQVHPIFQFTAKPPECTEYALYGRVGSRGVIQNLDGTLNQFVPGTSLSLNVLTTDSIIPIPADQRLVSYSYTNFGGDSWFGANIEAMDGRVIETASFLDVSGLSQRTIVALDTHEQVRVRFGKGWNLSSKGMQSFSIVLCPVVEEAQAKLQVVQQETDATGLVVANQQDVPLLRFEATAVGGDVEATGVTFGSAGAAEDLDNAESYSMWADLDHNGSVETRTDTVAPSGGAVAFNEDGSGGLIISEGETYIFEVHADIVATPVTPHLKLAFGVPLADYVRGNDVAAASPLSGIETNGVCSVADCDIHVTTAEATAYTVTPAGGLIVMKNGFAMSPRQLLGGQAEAPILVLDATPIAEDMNVQAFIFPAVDPHAADAANNVDRLDLYRLGEPTAFASATPDQCSVVSSSVFCANLFGSPLLLTAGATHTLAVVPVMKSDVDGGTSAHNVQFALAAGGVIASGATSGNNVPQNDGDGNVESELYVGTVDPSAPNIDLLSEKNQVVMSKVTSITNANPDAYGTAIVAGEDQPVGQFKFTAPAHANTLNDLNDWTLDAILFDVLADNILLNTGDQTNFAETDFFVYNQADPSVKHPCIANAATTSDGMFKVMCIGLADSAVQTAIEQGTDMTLVLEMDVINPLVSAIDTSTLRVDLTDFTNPDATTFTTDTNVLWIDKDAVLSQYFGWLDLPFSSISSTEYRN